ncbi:hypothetical protein [Aminicella lysinilytica]|uniref:hypothetical protein n=1 Tax=Aminicella lysinilytica TaxID=433323 RepID=UPI00105D7E92|nr:hypothetical protein [Aminicella lysinilytica]
MFTEIKVFHIGDYDQYYSTLSFLLLFTACLIVCAFFLIAYSFYYTDFTEHTLTYHNKMLGRHVDVDMDAVKFVHFTRNGIQLYYKKDEKPKLVIPFFRFGIVSKNGVDSFTKLLVYKKIEFVNDNKELPGYGFVFKVIRTVYALLCIFVTINALKYLLLVFMIMKEEAF